MSKLLETAVLREQSDVAIDREHARMRRLVRVLLTVAVVLWARVFARGMELHLPSIPEQYLSTILIVGLLSVVVLLPLLAASRSPHVLYRPSEIAVGFDDVV